VLDERLNNIQQALLQNWNNKLALTASLAAWLNDRGIDFVLFTWKSC